MKKLNVDQMSEIQGGRASDVINGICAGVGFVTIAIAFGLVLTGIGVALLVSIGAGCTAHAVGQYL
ncbi:MAG: hypothetical protein LBS55_03905 [Prevotellaceae bacterium]|jgi:hypothetical protein|nr:hypothetical protein [Prevotellaceae bacterium]